MINLFRKNQRVLMLFVAILTIIAFIFLYNTAQLDGLSEVHNAKIYGKSVTPAALDRQVKNYQLTLALGQYDLLTKLSAGAEDRDQALNAFVWNLLVLQHEARALDVEPTDDQVADRIKTLPVFQTSGQFDPTKYGVFLREQLAPRGFTERQIEEVMRDSLRVEKLSKIVQAPAAVSEAELRAAAKILQPITATAVLFDAAAATAGAQVADQEVKDYFERNAQSLNTRETRAVRYVAFTLPAGATLEGKAKVEAMQKLADAASQFVDKVNAPDGSFSGVANAASLPVSETSGFDRSGTTAAGDGEEGKKIADIVAGVAPTAFLLANTGSTSDVIQAGDAFYVVELSQLAPERPLTFDEAAPQIRERLLAIAANRLLNEQAQSKIIQMRESIAAGKAIEAAAADAGLKTVALDNLVPTAESVTPEQRGYIFPTLALRDGELSNVQPGPDGGFAVFLKSRGPLDDKAFEERRAEITEGLLENKRSLLFAEWLQKSLDAAKVSFPQSNRG